jgi:potassium efflux system protein
MSSKYTVRLLSIVLFVLTAQLGFTQTTPVKKSERSAKLFDDPITDSDYLMSIEKASEVLQSAYNNAEFGGGTQRLFGEIKQTQNKLDLFLTNLKEGGANVRNQQMYHTVLLELQEKLENQNKLVNTENETLDKIKDQVKALRKDTLLMGLIRDTVQRKLFRSELLNLRSKYKSTDSLMKANIGVLNKKKRLIVDNKIAVANALLMVDDRLEKSGLSLFSNEYKNLWESEPVIDQKEFAEDFKRKIETERSVVNYYANYCAAGFVSLAFFMALLAWYISRNIKYLKSAGQFDNLALFSFKYLNKSIFLAVIVVALNIAIVDNLNAPALFTELLQLVLLIVLSVLFKNTWSKKSMRNWLLLIALFIALCFLDLFMKISFLERCIFILINVIGIRYGFVQLNSIKDQLYIKRFFRWAAFIFIGFNAIALLLNLFGRVSLSHTLSVAAIIALTQIIALSVLLKIILEIILLQIYTIRVKHGTLKLFDHESLSDNLKKPFILIMSFMWLVVIASNLNIWASLFHFTERLLSRPLAIGNITFTFGGIVLFVIIIWVAHLLQKYVTYFFGEIDNEDEENINKRQHSKLLVTRLSVLIIGYLLAIAASGMPLDKLSIILGALGVGIGLGLQSIVNNFVSGIILIFDKPIQIGDIIEVSSQSGRVKSMGLRTTKINAPNGAEIIIPNGNILSQSITNWTSTDNLKLVEISFEVIGDASTDVINEIVAESLKNVPLVDSTKIPQIYYSAVAEGNYKLLIKFWCSIYRTEEAVSTTRQTLFGSFKDKGIEFKA